MQVTGSSRRRTAHTSLMNNSHLYTPPFLHPPADVLVHVVDASGTTDREGQLLDGGEAGGGKGGDPLDDVG